jgi:hypothetical protein
VASTRASGQDADDRGLRVAALLFTLAVLLHNGDHARRGGDSVGTDLFAAGSGAILLEVAVVVLVLQRHRLAPLVATVAGFSLAAGYVVAHVLPPRGWLSDSLFSGGASPLSQAAAVLEIAAALGLGTAGAVALRRGERPRTRPLADTIREPAVLAMALGNALIFAVSVATL